MSQRQKVVWRNARAALLGLGLFCGSAALAQGASSVLTGNVVDAATKAPVADVVVTATSPGLQGEQVVVTDATGLYRVPQLPPGTYTLRFEKESYRPFSRTNIDVAADRTLRLNVELLPETAGVTEISVVGSPPVVDVGSSATGTTINTEFIKNLAVSRPGGLGGANRSFDSLATVAPQAAADVYGVGINGTTSPENVYLIDGLSVGSPAYGTLGTTLTSEFVDEVNVITGGYMPEYGRTTGGAISAVTKSGGNEFHGSLFGTFAPGSFSGAPGTVSGATATVVGKREIGNIGDFGATLGGYILKDRLWFFVGAQYSAQRYIYSRSFQYRPTGTGTVFTPIDNSTQRRLADEHGWNYIGKLTFLISSDHRLSVSVFGTQNSGGGGAYFALRDQSSDRAPFGQTLYTTGTFNALASKTKFDTLDINGELNSSFLDKKLLVDIRAGWHHQVDESLPGDGSGYDIDNLSTIAGTPLVRSRTANTNITLLDDQVPQSVKDACGFGTTPTDHNRCPASTFFYGGGPGFIPSLTLDSVQAKGVLTYLLTAAGHHVLKAGVDGNWSQYKFQSSYNGGASYRTLGVAAGSNANLPGAPTLAVFDFRRYGFQSDVDTVIDEAIASRTTKSSIIGGFIQDSWSIVDKVTLNLGLRYDAQTLQGADGVTRISLKDQWSPRIGLVYDPTQQGRSKIFANYGKYYEFVPLDIANRSLSAEGQIGAIHVCNPNTQGRAVCDANAAPGLSFPSPSQFWANTGTPYPSAVDPDLKSPSVDEVVAGAEYEVLPNARAGVSYTYRNLGQWVEDMSTTDGNTYFIGNPGEGIGATFPKAKRTYHAVTVQFTKTFADLWQAQVSYTWSQLRGNLDGLFRPQDGQLDPNINSTFDLVSLLANADGPLSADITHQIKIFAAKEFPITPVFSTTLGGTFNANSGPPIDAMGAHVIYGDRQSFIVQRGSAGRLPWVTSLDAKINLNYRFSKDITLTAGVEAFNIFNSQRPTTVEDRYTQSAVGPIIGAANGSIPTEWAAQCPPGETIPANCGQGTGSLPKAGFNPDGSPISVVLPNPGQNPIIVPTRANWGQPTNFQAVRQFRFSLRVTF